MTSIVFDIGGTKMRVARANGVLGEPVIVPTPKDKDVGIQTLLELIAQVAGGEEIRALVGGVAGVLENGVLVRSPNLPGWEGVNMHEALTSMASSVVVKNDAALACLGEAVYGAGKDARIVAYLGIGTGVGGARSVAGVLDETHYNSEPGHQIINAESGKTFEQSVSGGALAKDLQVPPALMPREAYDSRIPLLATGVANTILLWSPDTLILGGPLIHDITGYRLADVIAHVKERLTLFPTLPQIRASELGDLAGLEGARVLVERF